MAFAANQLLRWGILTFTKGKASRSTSLKSLVANDIRTLSPKTRECYFLDEDHPFPTLYSWYTADNCRLECRMREAEMAVGLWTKHI